MRIPLKMALVWKRRKESGDSARYTNAVLALLFALRSLGSRKGSSGGRELGPATGTLSRAMQEEAEGPAPMSTRDWSGYDMTVARAM